MPFTPVQEHLARSAQRAPHRPALLGDRPLSYEQLDRDSRRLASVLRAHGLERGGRVALCLPKSGAAVMSIYATLRAGGAYVPIDPLQPAARACAILADCEPTALVTDEPHLRALGQVGLPASLRLVVLAGGGITDGDPAHQVLPLSRCLEWDREEEDVASGEEELAIILYTSGSTGAPKGVQIAHRNLDAFIAWSLQELALGPSDVFSNHAGLHFDLSTFDLFAAAAAGGAVWIVPEPEMRSPLALAEGMRRHGVTVWYSVPSILSLMIGADVLDAALAAKLRYVLFAGEVFPIKHLRVLQERLPGTALYNLYGPTETNVCTFFRVGAIDPDRTTPIPIGAPTTGARAWIADDGGPGSIGELMIEGRCVTPGYWRRTGYPGEEHHRRRIHATGDLVSLEDGQYVYRGRKDRMVKVNGFRVELGEIEAALLRHPAVAEAAVLPDASGAGTRLLAYCALTGPDRTLSLLEVKRHCGGLLPSYMLPHALVCLPALPKNPNGKLDLPRLAAMRQDGSGPIEGARDP